MRRMASAHYSASCHSDWPRRNNRMSPRDRRRGFWEIQSNLLRRQRYRRSRHTGRYRAHVPARSDRSRWRRYHRHYSAEWESADLDNIVRWSGAGAAASGELPLESRFAFPEMLQLKDCINIYICIVLTICQISLLCRDIILPYESQVQWNEVKHCNDVTRSRRNLEIRLVFMHVFMFFYLNSSYLNIQIFKCLTTIDIKKKREVKME